MSSTRMNRILGRRSACLPASAARGGGDPCASAAAPGRVASAAKLIAAVAKNLVAAGSGAVDDRLDIFSPNLPIPCWLRIHIRSEEHTSELQSLLRILYAVFCFKK